MAGEIIVQRASDITHIRIERAEWRGRCRERSNLDYPEIGDRGFKESRKGRIFLILPRKTENPNRIISKTRKTEDRAESISKSSRFCADPRISITGNGHLHFFSPLWNGSDSLLILLNFNKIYGEFHKWKTTVAEDPSLTTKQQHQVSKRILEEESEKRRNKNL